MAIDFKKCRETASGNIITPKGRLSFAQFLMEPNPKAKTKDGKLKYTTSFLIPPDADISVLKKAATDALNEEFGAEKVKDLAKIGRLSSPFLNAFDKSKTERNPDGDEQFKGWTLLRVASVQKPGIVGPNAKNVDDSSEVYSGRWACISVNPFAWTYEGKHGVSFGLQNVQLLDHDQPIGGAGGARAEDEFSAVEGMSEDSGDAGGATADSVFG